VAATPGLTMSGTLTTGGPTCGGCDEVFGEDYNLPSIGEHAKAVFANRHLPVVGPTIDGPIDVTQKLIGVLNELEKAQFSHSFCSQTL